MATVFVIGLVVAALAVGYSSGRIHRGKSLGGKDEPDAFLLEARRELDIEFPVEGRDAVARERLFAGLPSPTDRRWKLYGPNAASMVCISIWSRPYELTLNEVKILDGKRAAAYHALVQQGCRARALKEIASI